MSNSEFVVGVALSGATESKSIYGCGFRACGLVDTETEVLLICSPVCRHRSAGGVHGGILVTEYYA